MCAHVLANARQWRRLPTAREITGTPAAAQGFYHRINIQYFDGVVQNTLCHTACMCWQVRGNGSSCRPLGSLQALRPPRKVSTIKLIFNILTDTSEFALPYCMHVLAGARQWKRLPSGRRALGRPQPLRPSRKDSSRHSWRTSALPMRTRRRGARAKYFSDSDFLHARSMEASFFCQVGPKQALMNEHNGHVTASAAVPQTALILCGPGAHQH